MRGVTRGRFWIARRCAGTTRPEASPTRRSRHDVLSSSSPHILRVLDGPSIGNPRGIKNGQPREAGKKYKLFQKEAAQNIGTSRSDRGAEPAPLGLTPLASQSQGFSSRFRPPSSAGGRCSLGGHGSHRLAQLVDVVGDAGGHEVHLEGVGSEELEAWGRALGSTGLRPSVGVHGVALDGSSAKHACQGGGHALRAKVGHGLPRHAPCA